MVCGHYRLPRLVFKPPVQHACSGRQIPTRKSELWRTRPKVADTLRVWRPVSLQSAIVNLSRLPIEHVKTNPVGKSGWFSPERVQVILLLVLLLVSLLVLHGHGMNYIKVISLQWYFKLFGMVVLVGAFWET